MLLPKSDQHTDQGGSQTIKLEEEAMSELRGLSAWRDPAGFAAEVDALREEVERAAPSAAAAPELRAHQGWSVALTLLGWALAPLGGVALLPSAFALALGDFSRWILAHHLCHGAYDRAALPASMQSKRFGRGWRRFSQWLDWMPADAWAHEHNLLHHYRTNEPVHDPDLVQEKAAWLRAWRAPRALKVLVVWLGACVWKPLYYGPNTLLELERARLRRVGRGAEAERLNLYRWSSWLRGARPLMLWALWRSWLPGLLKLALLPSVALLWLGAEPAQHALSASLLGQLLANLHSFWVIVPNHAGEDLLTFEGKPRGKGVFYARQIAGSCDYQTESRVGDFLMGYLNYQIEHHVWPEMTIAQYRLAQPRLKALCARWGVPYRQEAIWRRGAKMVSVAIGRAKMDTLRESAVDESSAAFEVEEAAITP